MYAHIINKSKEKIHSFPPRAIAEEFTIFLLQGYQAWDKGSMVTLKVPKSSLPEVLHI